MNIVIIAEIKTYKLGANDSFEIQEYVTLALSPLLTESEFVDSDYSFAEGTIKFLIETDKPLKRNRLVYLKAVIDGIVAAYKATN